MDAGAEAWMVPVGERARVRVGGKIFLKPLLLRGSGGAASHHRRTVRVERDHVPASQVVGVVSFAGIASRCPEVVEVCGGASRLGLMVAWAGLGASLKLPPGRVVASGEVGRCAPGVGVVAEGSDRALNALEQAGRRLVAGASAGGDVPRPDQDRVADLLPRGRSVRPKRRYHHRQRQRCC
jgi:hypothetical protein